MKVVFYASHTKRFEQFLSKAMVDGAKAHGLDAEIRKSSDWKKTRKVDPEIDVAVIVGVKAGSRELWNAHRAANKKLIIIDKGYTRIGGGPLGTLYWRCSVGEFQPNMFLMNGKFPGDRWNKTGVQIRDWRNNDGKYIVFAGSSQKYCDFHDLGDANEYAESVIKRVLNNKRKDQVVVYRPKPSWKHGRPIAGSEFSTSRESISRYFKHGYCVITFGSNAALEAICNGIPSIVLGDGVARCVSSTSLDDLSNLKMLDPMDIRQWLNNVAYCQWTLDEMASGEAWETMKDQLLEQERVMAVKNAAVSTQAKA